MSQKKTVKKQSPKKDKLTREYVDIIKRAHILVQPEYHSSNLKQPSLLEEVDSFTTYEVSATAQDWK